MLTNFTLFFSFYLLTPLLPLYLSETFAASKDTIGLVLSGYTVMALAARILSGHIVDSYPRKRVLLWFLMANFILFGGYLAAGTLLWFTLVRTLHGATFGASTVANSTMAIDVLPASRRNEGIGYYGLSNNLGSALAPTVGILVYKHTHHFELLFLLAFITAAIGYLASRRITTPPQPQTTAQRRFSLRTVFLTQGWYIALLIAHFGFCWGLLSNYLAIYGKEHLGVTSGTGTYFLILSICLILSRLHGNRSLRQGRLIHNAAIGTVLSTIGYVLFIAWPSMAGYYASAVFIGLGNGHIWPAFQNLIISLAPSHQRGTANSTILTAWDLGMGLGILLGGIAAEHWGYDTAFWLMAATHILALLLFAIRHRSIGA